MKELSQADKAIIWSGGKPLYHMTPHENLKSILKIGLLPAHGNFVCLCENPLSWYQDYARLAVDIDAFRRDNPEVRVTTWLPDLDEVCVWGTIPPKYIRLCDGDAVRQVRGPFPQGKGGQMNESVIAQAAAKEPSNRKVQVDPNVPESPLELIVQASQYLVDEVARLNALAHDAVKCDTAYSRAFLVRELAMRLETYQAKGLQALVRIVNDLVDRYGKTPKEPANDAPAAS